MKTGLLRARAPWSRACCAALAGALGCCFAISSSGAATAAGSEVVKLPGWQPRGAVRIFDTADLFDYVNGAAELYLRYGFQTLEVTDYVPEGSTKATESTLTLDLYLHSSEANAFGIYAQERPRKGTNHRVGAEGVYQRGVLIFYKGKHFVRLTAHALGNGAEARLLEVGRRVATKLPGAEHPPAPIVCLPEPLRTKGSERFFAQSYRGHSFLTSAFVADYELEGKRAEGFIIAAKDPKHAQQILASYVAFAQRKATPVKRQGGLHTRLQDPYAGGTPVTMRIAGPYLWGIFTSDAGSATRFLEQTQANLRRHGLLPQATPLNSRSLSPGSTGE